MAHSNWNSEERSFRPCMRSAAASPSYRCPLGNQGWTIWPPLNPSRVYLQFCRASVHRSILSPPPVRIILWTRAMTNVKGVETDAEQSRIGMTKLITFPLLPFSSPSPPFWTFSDCYQIHWQFSLFNLFLLAYFLVSFIFFFFRRIGVVLDWPIVARRIVKQVQSTHLRLSCAQFIQKRVLWIGLILLIFFFLQQIRQKRNETRYIHLVSFSKTFWCNFNVSEDSSKFC